MMKRVIAVLVLVLVAVIALRIVIGFVSACCGCSSWRRWSSRRCGRSSTLKSAKRDRAVKKSSAREVAAAPAEDPVAVEMRRITEELRERRSQ